MVISKKAKVTIMGKINITLEGLQLCFQNSERLYLDSKEVSVPTKMALLELSLEEISKTLALTYAYEDRLFENEKFYNAYIQGAHIDKKKLRSKIEKLIEDPNSTLNTVDLIMSDSFILTMFQKHEPKIQFISKLIEFARDVILPFNKEIMDRSKTVKELIGRFYPDLSEEVKASSEAFMKASLDIDEHQLPDIIGRREDSLYISLEGGSFVSPISRAYDTDKLDLLVFALLAMSKGEIVLMTRALSKNSIHISGKN